MHRPRKTPTNTYGRCWPPTPCCVTPLAAPTTTAQPFAPPNHRRAHRGRHLLTAHRPANTLPETVPTLVEVIEAIELPIVFPVHPRTRAALERAGLWERAAAAAHLTAPLGYLDFTALLMSAAACLTDSGGVQKEAYLHSVPCVTMRDTSEWVETIAAGWNRLVDLDPAAVAAALAAADRPAEHPPLYGDGDAAGRIAAVITAGR